MNTDWIEESGARGEAAGKGSGKLELGSRGLVWRGPEGEAKAPWSALLGVVLLPRDAPEVAYVMVPRRPPMPPWLEVGREGLPGELGEGGFAALRDLIRQRSQQRGYREVRHVHVGRDPAQLRADVLARREIPGSLEVPVGPGPLTERRLFKRSVGGALAGALGGVMIHPDPFTIVAVAFLGGALPTLLGRRARRPRLRLTGRPKHRVLVLTPEGAVVGLPDGVRAFSWTELQRFERGRYEFRAFGDVREERDCLAVVERSGRVIGRIDAAWFDAPLDLIVAVAEAYRERIVDSSFA